MDFVADFERAEDMAVFDRTAPFGTILILNVLEHTFNPLQVLDNARALLKPGGALVVLTPAVWPLHNYPFDAWRILPDFYTEYARRRGMRLLAAHFEYVGFGDVSRSAMGEDSLHFRLRLPDVGSCCLVVPSTSSSTRLVARCFSRVMWRLELSSWRPMRRVTRIGRERGGCLRQLQSSSLFTIV